MRTVKDQKGYSASSGQQNNKSTVYKIGGIFLLLTVFLGAINVIPVTGSTKFPILIAVQLGAFLCAGMLHINLVSKYFDISQRKSSKVKWIYILALTILMIVILLLLYSLINRATPVLALASGSAFLFPFIISEAWKLYLYEPVYEPLSSLMVKGHDELISKNEELQTENKPGKEVLFDQSHLQNGISSYADDRIGEGRQFTGDNNLNSDEIQDRLNRQQELFDIKWENDRLAILKSENEKNKNHFSLLEEEINAKYKNLYESQLNAEVIKREEQLKELYEIKMSSLAAERSINEDKLIANYEGLMKLKKDEYEKNLQDAIEEARRLQISFESNTTAAWKLKNIQLEKNIYENKVKDLSHEFKLKTEAYEKQLDQESQMVITQKEFYEKQLANLLEIEIDKNHYELLCKELQMKIAEMENEYRIQLNSISEKSAWEKEIYASELTEKQNLLLSEIEFYINKVTGLEVDATGSAAHLQKLMKDHEHEIGSLKEHYETEIANIQEQEILKTGVDKYALKEKIAELESEYNIKLNTASENSIKEKEIYISESNKTQNLLLAEIEVYKNKVNGLEVSNAGSTEHLQKLMKDHEHEIGSLKEHYETEIANIQEQEILKTAFDINALKKEIAKQESEYNIKLNTASENSIKEREIYISKSNKTQNLLLAEIEVYNNKVNGLEVSTRGSAEHLQKLMKDHEGEIRSLKEHYETEINKIQEQEILKTEIDINALKERIAELESEYNIKLNSVSENSVKEKEIYVNEFNKTQSVLLSEIEVYKNKVNGLEVSTTGSAEHLQKLMKDHEDEIRSLKEHYETEITKIQEQEILKTEIDINALKEKIAELESEYNIKLNSVSENSVKEKEIYVNEFNKTQSVLLSEIELFKNKINALEVSTTGKDLRLEKLITDHEDAIRTLKEQYENEIAKIQEEEILKTEMDITALKEEIAKRESEYNIKLSSVSENSVKEKEIYLNEFNKTQSLLLSEIEIYKSKVIGLEASTTESAEYLQKLMKDHEHAIKSLKEHNENEIAKIQQQGETFKDEKDVPVLNEEVTSLNFGKKAENKIMMVDTDNITSHYPVAAKSENEVTDRSDPAVSRNNIDKNEKIWFYTQEGFNQKPIVFLNSVPLYIKLSVNIDSPEEIFPVTASLEMNLGGLFNHFINLKLKSKKNSKYVDSEQISFPWKFYMKGLIGNKELNPHISLRQNKIKDMSIIIARRVFDA